jgi:hypothetical protein
LLPWLLRPAPSDRSTVSLPDRVQACSKDARCFAPWRHLRPGSSASSNCWASERGPVSRLVGRSEPSWPHQLRISWHGRNTILRIGSITAAMMAAANDRPAPPKQCTRWDRATTAFDQRVAILAERTAAQCQTCGDAVYHTAIVAAASPLFGPRHRQPPAPHYPGPQH